MSEIDRASLEPFRANHPRAKNLLAQRFGRLLVVSYAGGFREARWLCRCNCGKTRVVRSSSLMTGATRSCGCLRKETASEARKAFALRRPVLIRPSNLEVTLIKHNE